MYEKIQFDNTVEEIPAYRESCIECMKIHGWM